jgi:Na+/phosphate symporter
MLRRIAIALAVELCLVSVFVLPTQAAAVGWSLRRVDGLLDRSVKELRAAERFVDQKHLGSVDRTVDQGIRLAHSAEKTVDKALAMLRQERQSLSKKQGDQIEQLITQAQRQLRNSETMIDRATQKSEDHNRLREMLDRVDRQVEEALKLLHEVVAGL